MPYLSKHFQIEPLTEGVFAAIAKDGGMAGANAGIVDLGDRALVFDTLMAPQAGRDLVTAAEQLTGHPVRLAVNSHWHFDHVLGNQSLPAEAALISTARTRELIAGRIPALIDERRQTVPQVLKDLEARLRTEQDPDKGREIGETIDWYRMAVLDLPTAAVRLPDQTFDARLTVHGTARTVELITFGGGHTVSDTILYLPQEQIAFVADLLFNGYHPWLGDGNPEEWLRIYNRIEALEPAIEVVVPGHGAVASPDAFAALRRYLPALRQVISEVSRSGGTADDAAARPVPAAFCDWIGEDTYQNNLRFLFTRQNLDATR